jgi:hypothetical protein
MLYPGDTINVLLPLSRTDGANPNVTSVPQITIINVGTGVAAVTAQTMTLVTGTQKTYKYAWAVPVGQALGDYLAIASYVVDAVTFTGKYVDSFRIGDSRVTGVVALDGTVAKDSTVAKDATVAKAADIASMNPDTSATIQAIKAQTDLIPPTPATEAVALDIQDKVTQLQDASYGRMDLDKTVNPQILTVRKVSDNTIRKQFQMTDDGNTTQRTPV